MFYHRVKNLVFVIAFVFAVSAQTPLFIRSTEKGFQSISPAAGEVFGKDFSARGMACGDLDDNGNIDIFIAQTDGASVILHNNGTKNHWIGLDLRDVTGYIK